MKHPHQWCLDLIGDIATKTAARNHSRIDLYEWARNAGRTEFLRIFFMAGQGVAYLVPRRFGTDKPVSLRSYVERTVEIACGTDREIHLLGEAGRHRATRTAERSLSFIGGLVAGDIVFGICACV